MEEDDDEENGLDRSKLFAEDDEEESLTEIAARSAPADIVPVNKPRGKRIAPPKFEPVRKKSKDVAKPPGAKNVSGAATDGLVGPVVASIEAPPPPPPSSDVPELLDDSHVVDPDELYSENERALSSFLKLHPMLRCAL